MAWAWALVRIAGIIVGVATLLRLATTEGLVTYDVVFQAWLDWLQWFLDIGLDRIEPALKLAIEWIRGFGIAVPDLQPEWRPAMILGGLLCGAFARHALSNARTLRVAAVVICAIVSASTAGFFGNVALGVLAAYVALQIFWHLMRDREYIVEFTVTFVGAAFTSALAALAINAVFAPDAILAAATGACIGMAAVTAVDYARDKRFGYMIAYLNLAAYAGVGASAAVLPADTLAIVAAIAVVQLGASELAFGVSRAVKGYAVLNGNLNVGLDILSTMGTAFAIAVMFADPPLF